MGKSWSIILCRIAVSDILYLVFGTECFYFTVDLLKLVRILLYCAALRYDSSIEFDNAADSSFQRFIVYLDFQYRKLVLNKQTDTFYSFLFHLFVSLPPIFWLSV